MRPFGTLPRPQSRFRRPRNSWIKRMASASTLRLSFAVVYLVVAGAAGAKLYTLLRNSGYFYSIRDRQEVWRKFPEESALSTLEAIYGNQSDSPEMRLVRQVRQPFTSLAPLDDLLKDPKWSKQARLTRSVIFEARLTDLERGAFYYRFEELLAVSENGKLLTSEQRRRLDSRRRSEVEWFLSEARPESEARVQAFCFRMWGWYSRPWPLESAWRQKMQATARRHQRELVAGLSTNGHLGEDTQLMRRLQLQVRFAGLSPEVVEPLLERAIHTRDWRPLNVSDNQLVLIAHFKKVLPNLDLSRLLSQLTPKKREILDCLRDLTANPK